MKKILGLTFAVSLLLASRGFAALVPDFSDSFTTDKPEWTDISGIPHWSTITDPGNPANKVLNISILASDFYPPDQPQAQAFNVSGKKVSLSVGGSWSASVNEGLLASNFGSFGGISQESITPHFDAGLDVIAGGHDLKIELVNNVFSAAPGKLIWVTSVDGVIQSELAWSASFADSQSELHQYNGNLVLMTPIAITGDAAGNISFSVNGIGLFTDNLGGALPLTSAALYAQNHGQGFSVQMDDMNVAHDDGVVASVDLGAVPEPSTYGLIGAISMLGLVAVKRFRKRP